MRISVKYVVLPAIAVALAALSTVQAEDSARGDAATAVRIAQQIR
jgi:hypothetical protein